MIRRYLFGVLFALLAMLFVTMPAMARDKCNCAGVCSANCNCGCVFDGPGTLRFAVGNPQGMQLGIPQTGFVTPPVLAVGIPQTGLRIATSMPGLAESPSDRRSNRSDRRAHGGNRLSGHSTDHWSQQLNWGRR